MHLLLENFRQHKHLELDIPDTGLIRLDGTSGAGKSTVLDAILEALYGEADDITPWGESKSKVTLTYKNMVIVRTKGPVSLKLTIDNESVFRDEVAQGIIDTTMSMGPAEFLASSYVRQAMEGSLLSLPPAEQLRFVQELAIGDYNPETFKEKLADYVKVKQHYLSGVEGQITSLAGQITRQKEQVAKKIQELPSPPDSPKTLYSDALLSDSKKELSKLDALLRDSRTRLNSSVYSAMERLDGANDRLDATKIKNNEMIQVLGNTKTGIRFRGKENLQNLTLKLAKKKKFHESKDKLIAAVKKFTTEHAEFKDKKISQILPEEIKQLDLLIKEAQTKEDGFKTHLHDLGKAGHLYDCPSCSAVLRLDGQQLVQGPARTDTSKLISDTKKCLLDIRASIEINRKKKDDYTSVLKECDRLKADMGVDPEPTLTLDELHLITEEESLSDYSIDDINNRIARLQEEIQKEQNEVSKIKTAIGHETPVAKSELLDLIKKSEEEAERLKVIIRSEEVLSADWLRYRMALKNIENISKLIGQDKTELELCQAKMDELLVQKTQTNRQIIGAKKNKELADFASISACDIILDNINENARSWLDKFFPEDGTSIVLKNSTVTKAGNEKPKLSINIYHKGKEAKKLPNLSGGERSRAFLSFQLALSEMYKSPILLLDEAFAGLPPDQKAELLEYLREFAEERLVLVVEHGANSSQFQDVITLT